MRKSLTVKMFMTIFTSFAVLILAIMLFLYLYFNYSYRDSKINRMTQAINEFAEQYLLEDWKEPEIYRNLANFNDNNNVSLYIFDSNGAYYSEDSPMFSMPELSLDTGIENSYYITVLYDGIYYDIMLAPDDYNLLGIAAFESDKTIDIEGYMDNENYLIPVAINGITLSDGVDRSFASGKNEISEYKAKYINTNVFSNSYPVVAESNELPTDGVLGGIVEPDMKMLITEADYNTSLEKNGVIYEVSEIPYTDLEQVYFTKQIITDDRVITFSADMSLHSVSEIVGVISSFLPWFLLGAILLALVISLFYSKTVSRPIIKITKAADSMAAMELETRSDIKREDELGRLSDSLNTLSENLGKAMDELVIKNRQLAEDYAVKERQEESRKAFIANASHELKTPLGVIKGYTEAIRDGIKTEKQDYYMDIILDEISRMDHLVEEMMQLSKFEAGADEYMTQPVDLDELTETITQRLSPAADARKLHFNIKKPLGIVEADKSKIHQVIFNLLANAVKYADRASGISVESITVDGMCEMYIKNECPPLSEENLSRIWERFYKADSSHTRDSSGSGLGLSIVRTILEGHNAEYGVYNTRKGICFHFKLPIHV